MKPLVLIFPLVFFCDTLFSQTGDSSKTKNLDEVIVTAFKEEAQEKTSLNISSIKPDSIKYAGSFNLSEMLSKTPGVNMLSTGVAIAKPVIRGLYGNRVLILLSGLKFDNQQWQEEHGLGMTDIGISKVELIKGPMSVLYETEAMGGIVNIIEENKAKLNQAETDVGMKYNSNTNGGSFQAGYKINKGNKWYRIRAGIEQNADYSDGNNKRVLNSRFDGYTLKSTYGFIKKKWQSTNNLMSSFNRFGFIFNDIYTFITPDDRWSRNLNINPAHLVLLNIFSSENKIFLDEKTKLSINAGVQSNERMEKEGGGSISLNMHLLTVQYLIKYEKEIAKGQRLIISHLNSFEDNTNFGSRKIVPDADIHESNLSLYYEAEVKEKLIFENGISLGEKFIKTYFTPSVNGQGKDIQPFDKFSPYYNAFTGLSFIPNKYWNAKLNVSTGVRVPNLAELSSDGLHEGIFTYEIGNPYMKNEQVMGVNFLLNHQSHYFHFNITPFYNYFLNFVYLAPTTEDWYGFPVYRYKQQDAQQYGVEAQAGINPVKNISLDVAYSEMTSITNDQHYTPYIPAKKLVPSLQYRIKLKNEIQLNFYTDVEHYFLQNHVYTNEVKTPEYSLWNIGASSRFYIKSVKYDFGIRCNNALNQAYYDHLSRFKYYGINNIGRNLSVQLKCTF